RGPRPSPQARPRSATHTVRRRLHPITEPSYGAHGRDDDAAAEERRGFAGTRARRTAQAAVGGARPEARSSRTGEGREAAAGAAGGRAGRRTAPPRGPRPTINRPGEWRRPRPAGGAPAPPPPARACRARPSPA